MHSNHINLLPIQYAASIQQSSNTYIIDIIQLPSIDSRNTILAPSIDNLQKSYKYHRISLYLYSTKDRRKRKLKEQEEKQLEEKQPRQTIERQKNERQDNEQCEK